MKKLLPGHWLCDADICDFCRFYQFNGDENGVYIDKGMCEHPDHAGRRDPADGCEDFVCGVCNPPAADRTSPLARPRL